MAAAAGAATSELNIRYFDPKTIAPYRMLLFVGKKGSGKSTLMKDIFWHTRDSYDLAVAVCGTDKAAADCREYIPAAFVYDKIELGIVYRLVEDARACAKQDRPVRILLLMDDILGTNSVAKDKHVLNNEIFREIAFNQRHLHVTFAVSLQYCMELRSELRSNVDYAFVFQENIAANRERLWKYFFGMFESQRQFDAVLGGCTRDRNCLVLDNVVNSADGAIADSVFYYKAAFPSVAPPNFKLGKPIYAKLSSYYRRRDGDGDGSGSAPRKELALLEALAAAIEGGGGGGSRNAVPSVAPGRRQYVVRKLPPPPLP